MRQRLISLLALCTLLFCLAVPVARAQEAPGTIYLCGETHANQSHLDQELALWDQLYQQGVRDLFVELPSYSAAYLNLWMQSDQDTILDRLYEEWNGTAMDSPVTRAFYQTLKTQYPETVFHGFDVGHQYNTTGTRYLMGLFLTGQMGSADWELTREVIDQGKTYYQTGDNAYRENQMAANLRQAIDALPAGTSVMVITGSAHADLYKNDYLTGTVPSLAGQLRQAYGENLVARNLTMAFDYSQAGQTAYVTMAGRQYTALRLADQDLSSLLPGYQSRTFWLVQDAYQAAKDLPLAGDVLFNDNFPWDVKEGDVFAIHSVLADGSTSWTWYRSDGTFSQGIPTTVGFDAN